MIEQAKAVAQLLREISRYPNVRISPSDSETQKEAANTIDALVAEVERLRNTPMSDDAKRLAAYAKKIDSLIVERDSLLEDVQRMKAKMVDGVTVQQYIDIDNEVDALREEVERLSQHIHTCGPNCTKAGCMNKRLMEEVEQLTVQLAGCGVAALGNAESSKTHRAKSGDYGYSESYAEVCRAVDREIELRAEVERLTNVDADPVKAYCDAWEKSFLAENPFDVVSLNEASLNHIRAGVGAALRAEAERLKQEQAEPAVTAEDWLREKYGAHRGHPAWRELEVAYLAGQQRVQKEQSQPVAYWIPKAKQFCIADKSGRPFARAWEPLYTAPQDHTALLRQALKTLRHNRAAVQDGSSHKSVMAYNELIDALEQHLGEAK